MVGASAAPSKAPRSSRLTIRPKTNRRRRTESLWSRLPRPSLVADACGRALRRALPAMVGLAVLGAIGGSAWAGYRFVTHSPRFAIDQIAIRGNHHLTADQIRALLPIHAGDNVFATDLGSVTRELRANPWIERADAHRELPHAIVVEVRERDAIAAVDLGGLYLVDAAGSPFKRAELAAGEADGLPIVTGLDRTRYLADPAAAGRLVQAALGALAQWRAQPDRPAIGEVHLDPRGALTLQTFDRATAIRLGAIDAALPARMHAFDAAWSALSADERDRATAIHLDSSSDHVTVAFTAPAQPAQKDQ